MQTPHNYIVNFIRENRVKLRLTQEGLAQKAGVGLRFIRDLEQGKETIQLDKLLQVLTLFGVTLIPGRELDGFNIKKHNLGKRVKINIRNGPVMQGMLTQEIYRDNKIYAWKLEPENVDFPKSGQQDITLMHQDIESIENL